MQRAHVIAALKMEIIELFLLSLTGGLMMEALAMCPMLSMLWRRVSNQNAPVT